MGNVFVDLQGLKDNHDFVADCCMLAAANFANLRPGTPRTY